MTRSIAEIRTLKPAEVMQLVDWAAAEGWNPGLDDASAFYAADPAGFIGAFVDDSMVAGISAVAYGNHFGFIGLYICHPDARGKGYGRAVWDAGMRHLDGRTIGLDGVPQQQPNYISKGFRPVYDTYRWAGRPTLPAQNVKSDTVVEISSDLVASVLCFDRRFFPADRQAFLKKWLSPPRTTHVLLRDGGVSGYGVARRCREGSKIGPLFAADADGAITLLTSLAGICGSEPIQLDVPETHHVFAKQLEAAGLQKVFVTARMYRGTVPAVLDDGIFAVTTLELG